GALKALRQLDDAAWSWQGDLRQKRAGRGEAPAAPPTTAFSTEADYTRLYKLLADQNKAGTSPANKANPRNAPNSARRAGDVESRLREVERKLDRLLKALDEKAAPRGGLGAAPKSF